MKHSTFLWRMIVCAWLAVLTSIVVDLNSRINYNDQAIRAILEIDSTQTENICIIVDGLIAVLSEHQPPKRIGAKE